MNKYPFDTKFSKYNSAASVGLAAMVMKGDEVIFKQGYGLRNLETKESIDADTNFRLASVSKQFTAMCIAILEERREISTSDSITKYFPDLPNFMDDIKIHHLLHHTSGLPEYYYELCSTKKGSPLLSNIDIYNFYKNSQGLNFIPGNKSEYSNGGYNVLATLVEKVTQEPFFTFITEHIFTPLKMFNTRIVSYPIDIPNCATSYSQWPFFDNIDFNTGNALIGEDGVYCSLNDTEKWISALDNNALVNEETMQKVFTSGVTNNGDKVEYGYGWELYKYHNQEVVGHGGLWCGFSSSIIKFIKLNIWIACYSNSLAISSSRSMHEIAKYFFEIE